MPGLIECPTVVSIHSLRGDSTHVGCIEINPKLEQRLNYFMEPDTVIDNPTLEWLLEGDPAIRWQAKRDLLGEGGVAVEAERRAVAIKGWGAGLLSRQDPGGTWGGGLYSPKWISTTYTLLLLRRLGLPADNDQARRGCRLLLEAGLYTDGGINYSQKRAKHSETCITGLVLSILAYFRFQDERLHRLVDHLIEQQMGDAGWNCQSYHGAVHSSFHTTISALEGLREFEKFGDYRKDEVQSAQLRARDFLLEHRLYRSHRTGEVVHPAMTRFSFPPRWHYDVLRGLDYFQEAGAAKDGRLDDAIDLLLKKRRPDGSWPLQNRHPGRVYFEMEQPGKPSRWNTLRALRVLKWWMR